MLYQKLGIWLGGYALLFVWRIIGVFLGFRAYYVLRKRFYEQEMRKKRKLRYMKLKKQIQTQKDVAYAHRKI